MYLLRYELCGRGIMNNGVGNKKKLKNFLEW